ncbi:MAG: fumarylacetoacetate hydrolase family protein [Rhodospirillales bacterium]|nr:fumarylacetoacetate hydrolase family protein [Rhodospirillales bacterium]
MKLVSYTNADGAAYGVALADENGGGGVIVPSDAFLARFATIKSVLEGDALAALADDVDGRAATLQLEALSYLPPLHDAEKVICIGVNYPKRHPVEGDIPPPKYISTFGKFEGSVVGHNQPIQFPDAPMCETFDYEGELVLVIGKGGRNISKEKAFDHIAGYTIMNDGSVREWQKHSVPAGKNFFAASACGPWMVTADEIDDPFAMKLSTRLNGEEVQSTTAGEMIFSIPTLVNYVSTFLHLKPGDIISTGSPEGSGGSRIPQRFLNKGDRLDITWSGVGTLKTWVA